MALPLALAISLATALAGWLARALSVRAVVAATAVGTAVLWRTGWAGFGALGTFFLTASALSRLAPDRSAEAMGTKGARRDPWQVLANGGAAALGALLAAPGAPAMWLVTASFAVAAADTWATSVGAWSRNSPRHILRWTAVPAGTSGGVTLLGTAGALAGAALVGLAAAVLAGSAALFPLALGVGMLGMGTDSVLGAALQGRFYCDACGRPTERRRHDCGHRTRVTGGCAWLTNDGVNGLATALGAAAGWLAWSWWA